MEYIAAIIGVAGTILGTILGFLLNVWANSGKIKFILLNDWDITAFVGLTLDIEIISTYNCPAVLRDFSIKFSDKQKKIYASQLDTTCVSIGNNPIKNIMVEDFVKYELSLVKCEPKSRAMVRFGIRKNEWTEEEIKNLKSTKSIKIIYTDNKGKKKKFRIKIKRTSNVD